jgi:N-acetylmuramoyl-L-alanine amidase
MDVGAAEIERWHRQRGFLAIGYHFVIRRNGVIEKGRDETVIGAHVENHNATTIGICMVGGIDLMGKPEDNFTAAQYATLHSLLKELQARYPNTQVLGHRDFPKVAKACPSFDVRTWLKDNPL